MRFYITLLLSVFSFGINVKAQDSVSYNKKWPGSSKYKSSFNSTAKDLQQSLESNNDTRVAQQYVQLARQLEQAGDLAKAEQYLKKALDIYNRQNNTAEAATITRNIAKIQESQNKLAPAISNYRNAAAIAPDKRLEEANNNDADRLVNNDKPQVQEELAEKNVVLFDTPAYKDERSDAYRQLAETQLKQNNADAALKSIDKAIATSSKDAETSRQLNKQLVNIYSDNNKIDSAILLAKELVNKAKQVNDESQQIDYMIMLAGLYTKAHKGNDAIATLQEAYDMAVKNGNTFAAKAITERLASEYQSGNNQPLSIQVYKNFLHDLDSLVKKDSSLLDRKLFALTEGRIRQLEQERILQAELIKKTKTFNYFLIAFLVALLVLVFLIVRSLGIIKQRNKKIALQSLRREMNPHFIFNSLNSVNQYIAENNELEANKYLSSYSGLMRNVMEHSGKDFVSITTELEQLQKYLELEHRRFKDKFDFDIIVDGTIDKDLWLIPNMLVQPHLENAVWHGLRYKETKGKLTLEFERQANNIIISVKDDGIGLEQSKALKTANQKVHQSRGLTNTKERIQLLNDIYKLRITMKMHEAAPGPGGGTIVIIEIPVLQKMPL